MFEIAKQWFSLGLIDASDLIDWVKNGSITQYDYKAITGKEYPA